MGSLRWVGKALPVADVWTLVVGGTWVAADTLTLTINGRSLVLTVGATVTTTAIATAVKEMWNGDAVSGDATRSETGDNVPEFAEYAATVVSSTVTITAKTKGVPGTVSRTLSSASGTAVLTHATTGTGPNDWSSATNWDTGSVPIASDTVYLDDSAVDVLYGLAQSGVTLAALYIDQSFTGKVGLPYTNANGYPEYRATYLAIGATVLRVGSGQGQGSGRIKIDNGSVQTALTVVNTGTPEDQAFPALIWKGTNASNTLACRNGSVGVAVLGDELATLATFRVDNGSLYFGPGVTLSGALQVNNGGVLVNSAVATSLLVLGGSVVLDGTGAVAQLTVRGGYVTYNTTGTLGGATVVSGTGVLDFEQDPSAKTVTNPIDLYGQNCGLWDVDKVVASLVADLNEGARPEQVRWGDNVRLSRGTPA